MSNSEKDLKQDITVQEHEHNFEYSEDGEIRIEPTEEDYKNLREVADHIPKAAYLVILLEFCERFTYYGLTGPFQNYIQNPAPESCKYTLFYLLVSKFSLSCNNI
jgi:POT family proton-dependent oligopeptide transporter